MCAATHIISFGFSSVLGEGLASTKDWHWGVEGAVEAVEKEPYMYIVSHTSKILTYDPSLSLQLY